MYFNVNFNVFFRLMKVHLLVSELYIYQNVRRNDKKMLQTVGVLTGYCKDSDVSSGAIKGECMIKVLAVIK